MKKILLALAFVVLVASSVMAAGSCVLKSSELVYGTNSIQKKIVKLTCTGDGSIAAYSFDQELSGSGDGISIQSRQTPEPPRLLIMTLLYWSTVKI